MNYARFYALLRRMRHGGDPEELKRQLVSQGTGGRTESLREVTPGEYASICNAMEREALPDTRSADEERRYWRSACLKLMQQIGVDTTSWAAVNAYCRSPKIAGVEFRRLEVEDLRALSRKLRVILKKEEQQLIKYQQ